MNRITEYSNRMTTEQYMRRARRYRSMMFYRSLRKIRNWIGEMVSKLASDIPSISAKTRKCHC